MATTVNSPTDENLIEQLKAANQAQLNVQKQKVDHLSQVFFEFESYLNSTIQILI